MFNVLTKLQRQPLRVRKQIALVTAAAVTGVIVLLWFVGLSASESTRAVTEEEQDASPFQALTDTIGAFFRDTTETLRASAGAFSAFREQSASSSPSATSPTE